MTSLSVRSSDFLPLMGIVLAVMALVIFLLVKSFRSLRHPLATFPSSFSSSLLSSPPSSSISSTPLPSASSPEKKARTTMSEPVQSFERSLSLGNLSLLDESEDFEYTGELLEPIIFGLARSPFDEPVIREGSPIGFDVDSDSAVDSDVLVGPHQVTLPQAEVSVGISERDMNLAVANPTSTEWLRWAIAHSGVFETQQEELAAAEYVKHHRVVFKGVNDIPVFQWGLRYIPGPGSDNIFRTVIIDMLPTTATLDRILLHIRGGAIFSASLMDTSTITGCPTAMITFVHQTGAVNFLRRVARDGFYVGISRVQVRPVPTPTYLMATETETQIYRLGRTRCLSLVSRLKGLKKAIHQVLSQSRLRHYVECFGEHDPDGEVTVRFHSVRMAGVAYMALATDPKLKGVAVKPAADPCSL